MYNTLSIALRPFSDLMNVQIIHLYTVHVTQWERRQNECDSNIYMKWEIHCWGARARIPLEDSNSGGDATSGDFHTLWFGTDFVLFFYFWFTVYRVSKWISNCFFSRLCCWCAWRYFDVTDLMRKCCAQKFEAYWFWITMWERHRCRARNENCSGIELFGDLEFCIYIC